MLVFSFCTMLCQCIYFPWFANLLADRFLDIFIILKVFKNMDYFSLYNWNFFYLHSVFFVESVLPEVHLIFSTNFMFYEYSLLVLFFCSVFYWVFFHLHSSFLLFLVLSYNYCSNFLIKMLSSVFILSFQFFYISYISQILDYIVFTVVSS